jgi:hypothetical protein
MKSAAVAVLNSFACLQFLARFACVPHTCWGGPMKAPCSAPVPQAPPYYVACRHAAPNLVVRVCLQDRDWWRLVWPQHP